MVNSNQDTRFLPDDVLSEIQLTPKEAMAGKNVEYLTLYARGNSPICISTLTVLMPSPSLKVFGFPALTAMSCGAKWVRMDSLLRHYFTCTVNILIASQSMGRKANLSSSRPTVACSNTTTTMQLHTSPVSGLELHTTIICRYECRSTP